MANKNSALNTARVAKEDEFYTQIEDIENELKHYKKHFKGKVVLCNCDDPYESSFFKYFAMNFNKLGLKKLITTCYKESPIADTQLSLFDDPETDEVEKQPAFKLEIVQVDDFNGDGAVNIYDVEWLIRNGANVLTPLEGDGDFRSAECLEMLEEADIVCTNPPFSLFRQFLSLLVEHEKKFLIIGSQNAITQKELFALLKENKVWVGYKFGDMAFKVPDTYEPRETRYWQDENGQKWRSLGNVCWYTNLDIAKRHEELPLWKNYSPEVYPTYENYAAIEVSKVADIPCDYPGVMGVPITFIDKYNPDQFEILGKRGDLEWAENECTFYTPPSEELQKKYKEMNRTWRVQNTYYLDENGVPQITYGRIFIRNLNPEIEE